MSLSIHAAQPAAYAGKPVRIKPLSMSPISQVPIHFAGSAEDKFLKSQVAAPLQAGDAKSTAKSDLLRLYEARLFQKQQDVQAEAAFWKGMPLHLKKNPERLNYFDLLQLIDEQGETYPDHFEKQAQESVEDFVRIHSPGKFSIRNKNPLKKLKGFQTLFNEETNAKVTTDERLKEVMGGIEQAHLQQNLNRLKEAGLIETSAYFLSGSLGAEDLHYNKRRTDGIRLTDLGKAVLHAEGDNKEDLIKLLLPSEPDWWSMRTLNEEEQAGLREHLRKAVLPSPTVKPDSHSPSSRQISASGNPFAPFAKDTKNNGPSSASNPTKAGVLIEL